MLYENFRNGINVGGWLAQYDCNEPAPFTPEEISIHLQTFITEDNIRQIAEWGLDHIRLPLDSRILTPKKPPYTFSQETLSYIDQCVEWCRTYNLNLILDLHDISGNVYCQMDEPIPFLTDKEIQERFFFTWEYLAEHFKGVKSPVIMFELFNEISDSTGYLWNRLYKEAVRRIRLIDQERWILIGSNSQNHVRYLNQLDLLDDPLVFYTFHYYEPQVFTHQCAHFSVELSEYGQTLGYPGDFSSFHEYLKGHPEHIEKYGIFAGETMNDRDMMKRFLKDIVLFTKYSGRELYCGEFGVILNAPWQDAAKWLKDVIEITEANKIGHALWNYKELDFGLVGKDNRIVAPELVTELFLKGTEQE